MHNASIALLDDTHSRKDTLIQLVQVYNISDLFILKQNINSRLSVPNDGRTKITEKNVLTKKT